MQKMNKKALSPVIANTLMILLVLASLSILSLTVYSIIEKTSERISLSPTACINLQNSLELKKVCYNQETKEVEATLYIKGNPIKLDTLDFRIQYVDGGETFSCGEGCRNCEIIEQGIKIYYFESLEKPESLILISSDCIIRTYELDNC